MSVLSLICVVFINILFISATTYVRINNKYISIYVNRKESSNETNDYRFNFFLLCSVLILLYANTCKCDRYLGKLRSILKPRYLYYG